jgi:formiminotetrahydrofolate cyclodeaminase
MRLAAFLEALASAESTPGGGSAAAVAGATGAALVAMVGRLTEGKEGYEEVWDAMSRMVATADQAREAFLSLADRDTAAFRAVMAAFRMPKDSEEDKLARSAAIQGAYLEAADVPAEVARRAVELMRAAVEAIESGNSNAASDGVAAANLLFTAAQGALANVAINVGSIKDQEVAGRLRFEAETLDARSREQLRTAADAFRRSLGPV